MKEPGLLSDSLPEGVPPELTVSELEEMACRQQQQIESQRQLLAAKEQRLRFLKQHETKHQQVAAEHDRLRRLRDRVEAQEQKLRKLRALRGQVDQTKLNNASLTSDLESIRALFNEKEKELSLAVAKVEELTHQLEELQTGRNGNTNQVTSSSAAELEKLRAELLYRNKLNEQQTARLSHQREVLAQRQEEMAAIDRRIAELQERLHRKRLLNQQYVNHISNKQQTPQMQMNPQFSQSYQYHSQKAAPQQQIKHHQPPHQPPQQPLHQPPQQPPQQSTHPAYTAYHNAISNKVPLKQTVSYQNAPSKPAGSRASTNIAAVEPYHHVPSKIIANDKRRLQTQQISHKPQYVNIQDEAGRTDYDWTRYQPANNIKSMKYAYRKPAEGIETHDRKEESQEENTQTNVNGQQASIARSMSIQTSPGKDLATSMTSSSKNSSSSISRPCQEVLPSNSLSNGLVVSNDYKNSNLLATSSTTSVTYTNVHQKPVSSVSPIYQTTSTRIQPVQPQVIGSINSSHKNEFQKPLNHVHIAESVTPKPALPPKPAPPVKCTPPPPPRQSAFHIQYSSQLDKNVEERTSFSEAKSEDENGNCIETEFAGLTVKELDKRFYPKGEKDEADLNGNRTANNVNSRPAKEEESESPPPLPSVEPPSDDELDKPLYQQKELKELSNRMQAFVGEKLMSDLSQDSSSDTSSAENNYFVGRRIECPPAYLFPEVETPKDLLNEDERIHIEDIEKSSSPDSVDVEKMNKLNEDLQQTDEIGKARKGNLKNNNSAGNKRRVSFDPLALLLDASLEGELELVIRTAGQVKNPSASNDEGITALHNAICAGHFNIVRFLVQFGCDVNAQDSDGWTPLHCAASCNNLPMVRFLVEHGACIFATTLSDQETAAEKCEEDEEGFDGCSEFLYSVQEKLGILNNGVVYAVYDYEAHNPDELSFKEADRLVILRKGDEWEREWWWSKLNDKEGYVPRNLLGLYPRVHPKKVEDS